MSVEWFLRRIIQHLQYEISRESERMRDRETIHNKSPENVTGKNNEQKSLCNPKWTCVTVYSCSQFETSVRSFKCFFLVFVVERYEDQIILEVYTSQVSDEPSTSCAFR